MPREDGYGSYYSEHGPSYRNSHIGYKNLEKLYPRYDRLEHFLEDVKGYINDGKLSEAKELYTQIRLKPVDRDNYLESLYSDGIEYVEVRSIDINPFEKSGISRQDAEFVHLFMVYLLLLEEDESDVKWQEDALYNEEIVAENGFDNSIRLLRNGEKIGLRDWADEILAGMDEMNTTLNLEKDELIRVIRDRVEDEGKTCAKQLEQIVENRGFIPSQLSIAVHNKDTSIELIDLETIYNNVELEEVYSKSLPNRKD